MVQDNTNGFEFAYKRVRDLNKKSFKPETALLITSSHAPEMAGEA